METNKPDSLFSLSQRTIVITGAAGLLGKRHIEAVATYGGIPILLDLDQSKLDVLANKVKSDFGIDTLGYSVDITDEKEVEAASKEIVKEFGAINGLVNNAANNPKIENDSDTNFSRLENFPMDSWKNDIAVGLTGSYLCTKYFGFEMSKNELGGSIVNISSDLGLIAPDQRLYEDPNVENDKQNVKPVTYSVVKSGLIGLTRYTSTYWSKQNVRCNALCPGGIENDQPDDFLSKVQARIPMNRLAQPNEYQGTLVWMLSDASSYLNGAVISVDGGRTAW